VDTDSHQRIAENLQRVRTAIGEAARTSGRDPAEITIVAVTKYVGVEQVRALIQAGCRDLGESRPQELWSKAESLRSLPTDPPLRWHLVGHLQRNKISRTLPLVWRIHSVDSVRLLESLEQEAAAQGQAASILLEVNISADTAKHGFSPEELAGLVPRLREFPHVRVYGLMGMAALEGGRDRARQDFARLRQLRDQLQPICPAGVSLADLSMGMSQDYDLAIAEGATIVRIGSALFEGVVN
jgi:pyridoxal phosphate enzyme (YggS family)